MKKLNLNTVSALQTIIVRPDIMLRPLQESDGAHILQILEADPTIRKRVSVTAQMFSHDDIAVVIEKYQKEDELIRYTILKNDQPVGMVSFWRDSGFFGTLSQDDHYGFGFFLDPQERSQGIITDAVRKLMDVARENLKVDQFEAFAEDDNLVSIAVLIRIGLKATDEIFSEPTQGWIERKYVKKVSP